MSRQEKDNTLKISGKTFVFKESDIKLFRNLENAINNLGRTFQKSGKIAREEAVAGMVERYLSIMSILYDILTSSLDVKNHSVRRVTDASYAARQQLLAVFVTAGSTDRTQPWLAWEVMVQYNCLALHHGKMMRRLNGAIISALRKATCSLEGRREEVNNLDDYLVEITQPALQVKENIETLLENSDLLRLEEHQVSQLGQLLKRTKILLKWKRPQD